jgi:hypothetical protein
MTAKKTSKKSTQKPASKRAASAGKKTAKKAAKKTAKKVSTKKSTSKKSAPAKPAANAETEPAAVKKPAGGGGKVTPLDVNVGHVFALRPRVNTSFRPGDFLAAKHRLLDDSFANLEEAARAVVELALELTHGDPSRRGKARRR